MRRNLLLLAAACAAAPCTFAEPAFDAGADLRVRQEFFDNVPGLPGGGVDSRVPAGKYNNRMRYRARAWAETGDGETWRAYVRVLDEWRWNIRPRKHSNTFPDELVLDNLFLEAKGLFDGLLDFTAGRQDIGGLFGLDRIFYDATPGDGSRSMYSDMVRAGLDFGDAGRLDLFALYNKDDNTMRWGTRRSRHRSLTGFGGGAEPEMDDWGWGAVYSGTFAENIDWKAFAMQKRTAAFRRDGAKHPHARRELLGFQIAPRLTAETSLLAEAMGQLGRNGDGDWLAAWSACAGIEWKDAGKGSVHPFFRTRAQFMSGDRDAAKEDGGNRAWDPMWARNTDDSEILTCSGPLYGPAWWSNMIAWRNEFGLDFGRRHSVFLCMSPVFAAREDGLGGGGGSFKGLMSQARYEFPLVLPDKEKHERFEIFCHVIAEVFNPGDYYESDKPSWFLRWNVTFAF